MKRIMIITLLIVAAAPFSYAQNKSEIALNQVLTTYYEVKNALSTDRKEAAIEKAKALIQRVDAVPQTLPAEQQKVWTAQAAIIKSNASGLSRSGDIKEQRKFFEGISYAMIRTIRTLKFNKSTVYIQHCPMAKASWLNEKENIENPYYGKMMFNCGDVSETINSN